VDRNYIKLNKLSKKTTQVNSKWRIKLWFQKRN
jgi:hypothetical protein